MLIPGNQSSWILNERGPALNVFWSRLWRDGRRDDEHARLPLRARVVIERLTNKTEPEGAGQDSNPTRSFRFESWFLFPIILP